ncbi:MAG: DUF308 domain-containing protein [Acidimicrobiia bacterium]
MPEFQGKLRLMGDPLDVVKADIEVGEGSFALIVSDHEVGEWPLREVAIEEASDGFHVRVDGEEFVFTTPETAAFVRAVGFEIDKAKSPKRQRRKAPRADKPEAETKPMPVKAEKQAKAARKPKEGNVGGRATGPPPIVTQQRSASQPVGTKIRPPRWAQRVMEEIDFSNPFTKIVGVLLVVFLAMAVFAKGLLATLLLVVGMIGLVIAAGAIVDPILAARFPNEWPPMRVIRTGLVAVAVGLLLIAF